MGSAVAHDQALRVVCFKGSVEVPGNDLNRQWVLFVRVESFGGPFDQDPPDQTSVVFFKQTDSLMEHTQFSAPLPSAFRTHTFAKA